MASSSSPSLPPSTYGHHVYISFRRDDESRYVTDMIDRSLDIRGVHTFRDTDHLVTSQTGTNIQKELREGMQDSTISVVMLSKGYLASSWCLEELVRILDCRERKGMVVLPIFYGVDPSDIRKARGYAAEELRKQKVGGLWWRRWKNALEVAGGAFAKTLGNWEYMTLEISLEA
ncbi:hypothetical protein RJ639_010720 [Escallonia herrerae]|uniref:ADP-ribosyl cyclase/cyclic ADP-ribose hydrolase n=1 Tax=Escallonia herrerae TaxID=1293975 RepID=A0AA88VJJ8_9ASTE|nr:hypothetical protein RJ639_010720 [Escallonia herrerae]